MPEEHTDSQQRHNVPGQIESLDHQAQGPARGFAAGPHQFVVVFRIFEMGQLQSQCFLQNHDIDLVAQQHPQNGLTDRVEFLRTSHQHHQRSLNQDITQDIGLGLFRYCSGILDRSGYGVDEQTAHRGDGSR